MPVLEKLNLLEEHHTTWWPDIFNFIFILFFFKGWDQRGISGRHNGFFRDEGVKMRGQVNYLGKAGSNDHGSGKKETDC